MKSNRGVAIFAKTFMGIPAHKIGKNYATANACGGPSRPGHSITTQRIRIDCVSEANHNLIRLLDKPDGNRGLI
jgi:hypothetical protein